METEAGKIALGLLIGIPTVVLGTDLATTVIDETKDQNTYDYTMENINEEAKYNAPYTCIQIKEEKGIKNATLIPAVSYTTHEDYALLYLNNDKTNPVAVTNNYKIVKEDENISSYELAHAMAEAMIDENGKISYYNPNIDEYDYQPQTQKILTK